MIDNLRGMMMLVVVNSPRYWLARHVGKHCTDMLWNWTWSWKLGLESLMVDGWERRLGRVERRLTWS
jgi:hypothetical protein